MDHGRSARPTQRLGRAHHLNLILRACLPGWLATSTPATWRNGHDGVGLRPRRSSRPTHGESDSRRNYAQALRLRYRSNRPTVFKPANFNGFQAAADT
jgi:hypothetical protein